MQNHPRPSRWSGPQLAPWLIAAACALAAIWFARPSPPATPAADPTATSAPPGSAGTTAATATQSEANQRDPIPPPPKATAPVEPEYEIVEFPEAEEDDDPYAIREFIETPDDRNKVRQSGSAPATGAEDEPDRVVNGEFVDANAGPPPSPRRRALDPLPEPTIRAREFSGICPSATSSVESPVAWAQMPTSARDQFPRPRLGIISTAGDAERRFVMIGRHIVREGQPFPTGGVLLRLGQDTLVMSSGGCSVEIPLRALGR